MKRECNKNKENEMIKGMDLNKACIIPSYCTLLMQCLSLLVRLGIDTFTQNGIRLIVQAYTFNILSHCLGKEEMYGLFLPVDGKQIVNLFYYVYLILGCVSMAHLLVLAMLYNKIRPPFAVIDISVISR